MNEKHIAALEIGSSKIKAALGTVGADGSLSVKAIEEEPLIDAVRYGCILNVAETVTAITKVLSRLEARERNCKITGIYLAVGGRSVMSQPIELERRLPSDTEIPEQVIDDIFSEAFNYPLPERTILEITPRWFRVDNAPTDRPIGIMGSHVAAGLNVVSCRHQITRNLNLVLNDRMHLKVHDSFVRQLVEADLVVLSEEKRQGCMFVDLGAETTTVSIYKNGALLYLATIPMGSRNITRDITDLNILEERAEELKIAGGSALPAMEYGQQAMASQGADYTQVNNYVAARAGEIIANINEQIKYAELTPDRLPAGIILAGGGSRLNGLGKRLENVTGLKVRISAPGNKVRILDNSVRAADNVDVIAILAAAAKNPMECTVSTEPEPVVEPVVIPEPAHEQSYHQQRIDNERKAAEDREARRQQMLREQEIARQQRAAETARKEEKPEQKQEETSGYGRPSKPGGLAGMWNRLRDQVVKVMTEPEEDDEP